MKLAIKILIFTVFVPGTVVVLGPAWLLRGNHEWFLRYLGVVQRAGALVFLMGVYACAWCIYDFAVVGHGTPAPIDPPKTLVIRGLYRYTRNPMYLGVIACILGQALYFESLPVAAYAGIVLACFHAFVRLYEEPTLRRLFGESYDTYRDRVPRWIPRKPRTNMKGG